MRRLCLVTFALVSAPALASSTDFTVRGTEDHAVDLPYRLTAGTWFYTVSYQTDDDDAPSFYLRTVDLSCDGSTIEELSASARDKRLTVGPYPAGICTGWHEIDPSDYQLRSWSIRFVKEGSTPDPEPDPEPPPVDDAPCDAAGEGVNLLGHQVFMCIVASGEVHQLAAQKLSDKVAVFGRRSDPKAVVKLVGGCTWGAIAAVTTARKLQIRVYNTANGKEWEHNHNRGGLAPSAYAGNALCDQAGN